MNTPHHPIALALHLTPREVEVCILIASGETRKGVAKELGISERTVRFHIERSAERIREACPWIVSAGAKKVILRYFVAFAGAEAFKPKRAAA